MPYIIGWLFLSALNKQGLRTRIELTFVSKFRSVLLGDVLASRVLVSAFWRYHVSLQRKKCCQQIIGLDDESFSIAVCIDAKKKSVLSEMLGDAVRPALCV
jgi:hypothetical protein